MKLNLSFYAGVRWGGGANRRPWRLQSFSRIGPPTLHASLENKHGLCPPFHGLFDMIGKGIKWIAKTKVPKGVMNVVKPFSPILKPIIEKGKDYLTNKLNDRTGGRFSRIDDKIGKIVDMGKTFFKLRRGVNTHGLPTFRIPRMKEYIDKAFTVQRGRNMNKRYKRERKAAGNHGWFNNYKAVPHMKHIYSGAKKDYTRKLNKSALRLEKRLWKMSNKRMADAMM